MFATHASRPLLWRAFATNSAVLTVATLLLAASPATVSFPIAVAEALVLCGGLAAMLGVNLAVLRRALGSAHDRAPSRATAGVSHDHGGREGVRRLLVCWTDPQQLSAEAAARWADAELRRVLAAEGIDAARVSRLRRASLRYGEPCDRLLELDLPADPDALECLESPAWEDWLGDLRALGLHPGAMVAEAARVVSVKAD